MFVWKSFRIMIYAIVNEVGNERIRLQGSRSRHGGIVHKPSGQYKLIRILVNTYTLVEINFCQPHTFLNRNKLTLGIVSL